jgi:uncharacterized repeat protein (TIGR01451 family)
MAQGEATLMEGSGSQLNYDRWGDYSMMAVDPVDDCTFWYTQEYFRDSGIDWRSRVGAFRFPSCAPPEANLALTKSAAPAEISPGQTVTFTLVYANVGTTPAAGVVISDVVPTELEAARFESSPPVQATGTFSYTWQVGSLLPSEGGLITLTGRLRAEVTRPSVFTNTAGIASSGTEIDPSDNQATVVVRVAPYRGYFPLARKGWKGGP